MMKKRIIHLALLVALVGCGAKEDKDISPQIDLNKETVDTQKQESNREEKIEAIFKQYDYEPELNPWNIKEEGNKIVVLIKEVVPKSKPIITKLIYLEESDEILFLQIENNIIIQ